MTRRKPKPIPQPSTNGPPPPPPPPPPPKVRQPAARKRPTGTERIKHHAQAQETTPQGPAPQEAQAPPEDPPDYRPANSQRVYGRIAALVAVEEATWFVDPWIPSNQLSLIVGEASAGKSTFGAWLCGQARRPALLPGYEEEVGSNLLPRLKANGVDLRRTLLLDDRPYYLPTDREKILQALRSHDADLLWIDPIGSYLGECSENDGPAVRLFLESLCRIAREARVAIVAARHPGKAAGNICPGSREWRAVPRVVLEVVYYTGPPERRLLRVNKDPFGRALLARNFSLEGEQGKPRRWQFGAAVEGSEADCLAIPDRVERWKIDQAVAFLEHILAAGPQESAYVYAMGEREKLHDRCLRRAAERLGVIVLREGSGREHKSTWELPGVAPVTLDK